MVQLIRHNACSSCSVHRVNVEVGTTTSITAVMQPTMARIAPQGQKCETWRELAVLDGLFWIACVHTGKGKSSIVPSLANRQSLRLVLFFSVSSDFQA